MSANNDKTYKVRGTKFLLTYRRYLNEAKLSEFLENISSIKEKYVGFRNGNTRVAVWFEKHFTSNNSNVFKFDGFIPTIQNIRARKYDWLRVVNETGTIRKSQKQLVKFMELRKKRREALLQNDEVKTQSDETEQAEQKEEQKDEVQKLMQPHFVSLEEKRKMIEGSDINQLKQLLMKAIEKNDNLQLNVSLLSERLDNLEKNMIVRFQGVT